MDGYRYTCFLTDQDSEDIAALELRHRGRARVEHSIRAGKDTGMRNLPHHAFEHNQTWLELSLIAEDLLTWTKLICLAGALASAESKRLRHRVLHIAGRIAHRRRRTRLVSKPIGHGPQRSSPPSAACARSQRHREQPAMRPTAHDERQTMIRSPLPAAESTTTPCRPAAAPANPDYTNRPATPSPLTSTPATGVTINR